MNTMHTIRRPNARSLALLSTLGLLSLGGCVNHQVADTQSAVLHTHPSATRVDSMDILSELFQSYDSPISMGMVSTKSTQVDAQPVGPQLVAGDWLAWQCAIAGNYWEMKNEDNARFALTPDEAAD